MAIKKSELYSSLWKSCDELRGGMDASQYKDYVLVLLFVKYVSDKYAGQPYAIFEVPPGGSFSDMVALQGSKDIGDKMNQIIARLAEANDLKGVIDVADFNDADKLGKGKEMQDRLSNLVAIFNTPALDFRKNRAEGDDLLGDAYEYLMRHFATDSGKSKGQFYTPAEVSRVIAKVIGINKATSQSQTIFDPTCGSGSLLLKAADESRTGVTIYGQEMDNATHALARMNMILHDNPTAEIHQDNSLSHPYFKENDGSLRRFDFVVANPPFSNKAWSNGFDPDHDLYQRFTDGVPPRKNGDYAFLLHILRSLKSSGKGAVILPHGVLFRGNAEAEIRQKIVRRGYISGIIGLPPNLFYGTGIPACILVLDKENAASRSGIFMIDASKGFMKDGNKNRLRHQDIHKIVDVFNRRLELPKYSRMVTIAEIAANDYNLNIPRYIDSSEPEDLHDIAAHLLGGIPDHDIAALDPYWQVFPTLKQQLFAASSRHGYCQLLCDTAQIKPIITTHPEFLAYTHRIQALFDHWQTSNMPSLHNLTIGSHPKQLIETLSEDILRVFAGATLRARQGLAENNDQGARQGLAENHGQGTRKGNAPTIHGGDIGIPDQGTRKGNAPTIHDEPASVYGRGIPLAGALVDNMDALVDNMDALTNNTDSLTDNTPDEYRRGIPLAGALVNTTGTLVPTTLINPYDIYQHLMTYWSDTMQDDVYIIAQDGWKPTRDLIPPQLIISRYFPADQQQIEQLEANRESIAHQLEELDEEHGGEDGLLADAKNEKGKLTRSSINIRLKDILAGPDAADERTLLHTCLHLIDQEAEARKKIRDAQKVLDAKVISTYATLTENEVKTLVIEDKWLATISSTVQSELHRVSQSLTGRVKQLAERYATPLPALSQEVEQLTDKVEEHLKMMGFVWS